jgi:hypothetical protein
MHFQARRGARRAGQGGGAARARDTHEQGAGRARPGEEEGRGRERERREGEGKNSPLGIQIPAISTPNPRAPRGEREVEVGEGGYCAGEIK